MKKILFTVLILLNLITGKIQLFGQVVLTNKEFEVFADAYVDNQTCQKENELLKKRTIEIKHKTDSIFIADSLEKVDLKLANGKEEIISGNYKKGRDDCKEDNRKLNKWNKFFK